jgi:hypothetical protein
MRHIIKNFKANNAHRTILKPSEVAACQAQVAAIRAHPVAARILEGAQFEVVVTCTDPATGIALKAMIDIWSPEFGVIDIKGTNALKRFNGEAYGLGYHHQIAWYRRIVMAALGIDDLSCGLLAIQYGAAPDVGVFMQPQGMTDRLHADLSGLLVRLARCRESDVWPGRYPEVVEATIPAWAVDEEVDAPFEAFGDVDEPVHIGREVIPGQPVGNRLLER